MSSAPDSAGISSIRDKAYGRQRTFPPPQLIAEQTFARRILALEKAAPAAPKAAMLSADYLRRQADNCLHIARSCFDLTSVERMRLLAGELKAKADEIEKQHAVVPHIVGRDDPFKDKNQRE